MTPPLDAGVMPPVDAPVDTPPAVDLPPDPATVAPPLDRSVPTSVFAASSFLYSGPTPIQTGMDPAAIDAARVAVLRGRVTGRDGEPVRGATVTVLGHPELGQTLTRMDGAYDLVVNGGGALTVVVRGTGLLQAQRTLDVPWQDYVAVPEIVLLAIDPPGPPIDLAEPGMKVVRGRPVTDDSGTRRATLLFSPDTSATVTTDAGTQMLPTLTVHLTEFTEGARGPLAMPGSLPPTSAYTYAIEVTVDESGGRSVELSQPALLYVENFLGFAPGTGMPIGTYDRDHGRWTGLPNGIVLAIVAIRDGAAEIDSDGDGAADSAATLAALGITDLERQTLATMYAPGQVLWRSPLPHFSPMDSNRAYRLPTDARFPGLRAPRSDAAVDDGCNSSGSIIQCHNQALGEDIPVSGTPYVLHYQSDRQAGRSTENSLDIALSDDKIPASATSIRLEIEVAGQVFHQSFPPAPNQHTVFIWDGKDAYGRPTQGRQAATVRVGYAYRPTYGDPEVTGAQFAQYPAGSVDREPLTVPLREEFMIVQTWKTALGPWDALPLGLGGFTISPHHGYDVAGKILYEGTGATRRATTLSNFVLQWVHMPSVGVDDGTGGGRLAPSDFTIRPAGGYYLLDPGHRVVYDDTGRIVAGILTKIGTTPPPCNVSNDDGPADRAALCFPQKIAAGPDGAFFINDSFRILRVTADGIIHTVAGNGPPPSGPSGCHPTGVGGPARDAQLCEVQGMAVARDGAMYFVDSHAPVVFKVGVDGVLSIAAGTGVAGFSGDGGPASQAMLSQPIALAIAPDGSLVVSDRGNFRVRRIAPDGVITTIAGTGAQGQSGDGGPATSATFLFPSGVAVGPDGSIYIADHESHRVRVVNPQGVIAAFAGNGVDGGGPPDAPPTDQALEFPDRVSVGEDGAVYIFEAGAPGFLGRVVPAMPSFSATQLVIPSETGGELYVFDNTGRHLRTMDAFTDAVQFAFGYDTAGQLASITDLDGKITRVERDPAGRATAIVAPFGQRTNLALDSHGYLSAVTDPAGGKYAFTYGTGGLLATFTDPIGGLHKFTYDSAGRLTADQDPAQGQKTLTRTGDASDSTMTLTTALGRVSGYRIQRLATGDELWSNTRPDGTQLTVQRKVDGSVSTSLPDGTTVTMQVSPDPRFGMLSPVPAQLTLRTPGGLVQTQTTTRTATLRDPNDPTSLVSESETFTLNGKAFTRRYDRNASTKIVTIRSPLGRISTATLNDQGRIVSVTNPTVNAMQILYDGSGRPTSLAQGERQRTLTYGSDGQVASSSDALAHIVSYDRDPLGRVTQAHAPDGSVIQYGFDAWSDLLRIQPPGQADHRVERDILGLVRSYVAPDVGAGTSQTTYDYNADHQPTAITAPDGAMLAISYDTAGRPSSVVFPDGTIGATYDIAGRISAIDAPEGARLAFGYDGSLPTDVTWTGPVAGALHVSFDNDFRVASESLDGEPAIAAHYDDDDLLTGVGALTITRDAMTGRVKQTSVGSVTETYTFNSQGELSSSAATCGTMTLRTTSLTRDATGTITARDEAILGQASSLTYDHDARSQLAGVRGGPNSSTYTYDSNGNRLSAARPDAVTYVYDGQDRLVQQGNTTYAYTGSGQLQSRSGPSGITTYHYDLLGNLRSVQLPDSRNLSYVIDGLNRRIGKAVNGTRAQGFLYDNAINVIAELDGAGAVVSRFVYGTRSNVPDYMLKGGATYRIVSDAVGSPRLIVDVASCQVVQQIDYDEFGRVLNDTNPGFQPFGFAGGLYDRDTGLLRFGARDYDPDIGRFTAKDPLGFAGGGTNLYAYAGNNPINFIDPTGLGFWQALTDFSAGFGDTISFGFTRWVRKKLGVNDVVNPCSRLYSVGGAAGLVVGTIATGGLGAEAAAAEGVVGETRAVEETFEILNGVRRAKAAEIAGSETIRAEILNSGGNVVEVSLDALRSPKAVIDTSGPGLDRWLDTLKQTMAGSEPPPILVQPGARGIPISQVEIE